MNKRHWQDSNLQPTALASNSGEKRQLRPLCHRPLYITKGPTEYCTSKHLGVTWKILQGFEPATFLSAVSFANHSATETCCLQRSITWKNRSRIKPRIYKCSFCAWNIADNILFITYTYSSMVTAWIIDLKDVGSNPESSTSIKFCLHK